MRTAQRPLRHGAAVGRTVWARTDDIGPLGERQENDSVGRRFGGRASKLLVTCGMPRSRRLSPADLVSLSRLLLAGAFVVTGSTITRAALIGIAGVTDYLDGWLARQGGSSRYGAVIDPATDRAFVLTVVVTLVVEDAMTIAQCLVLMARDLITTAGVVIVRLAPAMRLTPLEARWSGKVVTALQFVTLVAIIVEPPSIAWLLPIVALASAVSIADYSMAAWRKRAVA